MKDIEKLYEILSSAKEIVVFTGAGISVPSGIPDFRSSKGIFNQKTNTNITPEKIVSHSYFVEYPEEFYDFYFKKMVYEGAKPNLAHQYFSMLEKNGKQVSIVTQNIDGLHTMAGSTKVYELHGSIHRNYCIKCHKFYALGEFLHEGIPYCSCGAMIKPDVVLYEEGLDERTIRNAISSIMSAEVMLVIGTSLKVYPAASFVEYFAGNHLIVINKSDIQIQVNVELNFNCDVIDVIRGLMEIEKKLKR